MGRWLRESLALTRLNGALDRVLANHGQPGVDGVTVLDFAAGAGLALRQLQGEVLAGRYQPQPLKRLWLPRPGKAPRPIAVPTVRDRVLQTAVAQTLAPLLEAEFEECSYAYRQGRSVRMAVERIGVLQRQGYQWVVEADIEQFFDRIPHARLLAELQTLVQDAELVVLVQQWLQAPVHDPDRPEAALVPNPLGVPQGSPLSPALANLYLDHLDETLLDADHALVRYADDFVVLARSRRQAEAAVALSAEVLHDLALKLNPLKTRVVNFEQGFKFLGWHFVRSLAVPARKVVEQAEDALTALKFSGPAATPAPAHGSATGAAGRNQATTGAVSACARPLARSADGLEDSMSAAWAEALAARPDWHPEQARGPDVEAARGSASAADNPPLHTDAEDDWDADGGGDRDGAEPPVNAEPAGPSLADDVELEPGMPPLPSLQRTLYLVDPAASLHTENRRLVVRREAEVLLELPAVQVDQVMLFGRQHVTTAALVCCLQHGIPVALLSRMGRYYGRLEPPGGDTAALLQAQCAAQQQPGLNLTMARHFVHGKIGNAVLVLGRYARHRQDSAPVQAALTLMRSLQARLKTTPDLDAVRGLEGAAAAAYFGAWRVWLAPRWQFGARVQQAGTDPINALLDLGYTLLHHAVAGLLQARGLHVWLGHLHALKSGHMALASDLMEEFRPVVVDTVLLKLCLTGGLQPEDFSVQGGVYTLKAPVVKQFIRAIETRLHTEYQLPGNTERQDLRRLIDAQVRALSQVYRQADAGRYQPCVFR